MPRQAFDRQLRALEESTAILGGQVLAAVRQAIQAFDTQDLALAQRVVEEDSGINRWEHQILDDAALLLTLQAPVASDLRRILGVSRTVGYHERSGDHARDIARTTIRMAGSPPLHQPPDLPVLEERVLAMLQQCLLCFQEQDATLARAVCALDDGVDQAYGALFTELLSRMRDDSATTVRAAYTLFVARNLERIADYAANVAESVIYVVTGHTEELN